MIVEKLLFHQGAGGLLQRAVGRVEALQLMKEFHESAVCGGHIAVKLTNFKIFDVGYH